jgi:hypothetical protein
MHVDPNPKPAVIYLRRDLTNFLIGITLWVIIFDFSEFLEPLDTVFNLGPWEPKGFK